MVKKGRIFLGLGLLFLMAALSLACWNMMEDFRAGKASQRVLEKMEASSVPDAEDKETGILLDPESRIPVEELDGQTYMGILRIPSLDLNLPVNSRWSYPLLRQTPCRYSGSAEANDLVIMAHNYARHFGHLNRLSVGDEVTFTDVEGGQYVYQVEECEILEPEESEEMTSGDWDLTLFTCTVGGQYRVAVRCSRTLVPAMGEP